MRLEDLSDCSGDLIGDGQVADGVGIFMHATERERSVQGGRMSASRGRWQRWHGSSTHVVALYERVVVSGVTDTCR